MKKNIWVVTGCLLAAVTVVSALLWQIGPEVECTRHAAANRRVRGRGAASDGCRGG